MRRLRRREARRRNDSNLTYRELAAITGWSSSAIGLYLSGKALAPTDRFDILVQLLGAGPSEQGLLATARDRIEEARHTNPTPAPDSASASAPGSIPASAPGSFSGTAPSCQNPPTKTWCAGCGRMPPPRSTPIWMEM